MVRKTDPFTVPSSTGSIDKVLTAPARASLSYLIDPGPFKTSNLFHCIHLPRCHIHLPIVVLPVGSHH